MKQRRALPVILGSVGLLMLVWLLYACVAPPSAPAAINEAAPRDLTGSCQTFTSTDVPKAIPDRNLEVPLGSWTTSQLSVTKQGYITDIEVTFTVNHTYPSDLNVLLCGPRNLNCDLLYRDLTSASGTYTVTFSSDPSNGSYDDLAPPYTGSYPSYPDNNDGGLTKFRSAAAPGIWRLGLRDVGTGDVGSLTAWSLEICTEPIKPTPTPLNTQCVKVYETEPANCAAAGGTWLSSYSVANTAQSITRYLCVYSYSAVVSVAGHLVSAYGPPDGLNQCGTDNGSLNSVTLSQCTANVNYNGGGLPTTDDYCRGESYFGAGVAYESYTTEGACAARAGEQRTLTGATAGLKRTLFIGHGVATGIVSTSLDVALVSCNWAAPTPTRACPTSAPQGTGWWMW